MKKAYQPYSELDSDPISSKYVALKVCSYKDSTIRSGDSVPPDWPSDAIEWLLKKEAIKLQE